MLYAFVFLIMFAAGSIQGACGFGAGLIGMSLLPLLFDYKAALPIMFIGAAAISLRLVLVTYRDVDWKLFLVPTLFSILGRVIGLLVFKNFSSNALNIILGVLIVLISLFQMFWGYRLRIRPSVPNSMIAGTLSGILGGLASASGPPLVVYYMNAKLDKSTYIATIQASFFIGALFSIGLLASTGGYTLSSLGYGAVAAAGIVGGSVVGFRLFHKMNRDVLHKTINLVLLAMGLSLVIKSVIR